MIGFSQRLLLVLSFCHGVAFAQTHGLDSSPGNFPGMAEVLPSSFARIDAALKGFDQPAKRTFALELGPKLIELKGFYLERRQEHNGPAEFLNPPRSTHWGRYFDLLAVSSQFGGKLVGESELAYSTLGLPAFAEEQPTMARLGLKGNWGKAGYGLSYRSFGSGFVSTNGAKVEHARDEKHLWTEYDFGLFRMRGTTGETWEKNSATNLLTLTRSAATSFHLNKPDWSASLSSAYFGAGQEEAAGRKIVGMANDFMLVFRPAAFLTIEPKLGFKREWDGTSGVETDTPAAAILLSSAPSQNFQFVGQASYAQGVSDDPLKDVTTVHSAASLNWNVGRSFLGEQSLAVQLDYRSELRPNAPASSQANLTGMIRFKVAGF